MTVRAARFVDTPEIARLIGEAHQRSRYATTATFDLLEAKQFVAQSIQRHGHTNYGGTLVLVSETDGELRGFMIAMLDQVYPCLKELMASDLLFVQSPGADPADAAAMLRALTEWAEGNPKVIEVHLGVSDGIGDWRRTSKLYARLGFEQSGAMFTKRFER